MPDLQFKSLFQTWTIPGLSKKTKKGNIYILKCKKIRPQVKKQQPVVKFELRATKLLRSFIFESHPFSSTTLQGRNTYAGKTHQARNERGGEECKNTEKEKWTSHDQNHFLRAGHRPEFFSLRHRQKLDKQSTAMHAINAITERHDCITNTITNFTSTSRSLKNPAIRAQPAAICRALGHSFSFWACFVSLKKGCQFMHPEKYWFEVVDFACGRKIDWCPGSSSRISIPPCTQKTSCNFRIFDSEF